jgi:hypothetical protein
VAVAEGVDTVEGSHVEVLGDGDLDDGVFCVCVGGGLPPSSR